LTSSRLKNGDSLRPIQPFQIHTPVGHSRAKHWALRSQSSSSTTQDNEKLTEDEIDESMAYLANLIKHRLFMNKPVKQSTNTSNDGGGDGGDDDDTANIDEEVLMANQKNNQIAYNLARGRFVDLTITLEKEHLLESLFLPAEQEYSKQYTTPSNIRIVQCAINTLQSLLLYGMQIGVKGSEEMQKKMVRHLFRAGDGPAPTDLAELTLWSSTWDAENVRKLKFYRNVELGKLLLAKLIRKRTAQGAFDVLVELGVWDRHVDTALLRSGFPVRFLEEELGVAKDAEALEHDPDAILGLRKDLRKLKVYTIDSASTLDIDDGISVQVLNDVDGGSAGGSAGGEEARYRYWIHIADVDRWAPRGSKLLEVAERRGTSLYLPTMTLCMFPENMSSHAMSLESWEDKCALSLGVELNADGTIIPSSIILSPSLVHVDYRLTYDQVDEMLDEGVGYTEEWQIGALLAAATKRREHRIHMGSTEGMVPFPIPRGMVTAEYNEESTKYDVSLKVETTHNSGSNMTAGGEEKGSAYCEDGDYDPYCSPVSSSQLIVTEMMILAGEAIGKWQQNLEQGEVVSSDEEYPQLPNVLELPFRRQPSPDFKSRETEKRQMDFLLQMNNRYPHAWYARRFFNKVTVSEKPGPHFGMGLDCYVQWTSPIRRLTDLQVHSALKRYLRRRRVNLMLQKGMEIPSQISSMDLGCDISKIEQKTTTNIDPIDYTSGLGMIFAGRPIQSSSGNYWLFEYIRQRVDGSDEEVMFESIVLGCVNRDRFQYAIYVYELGLEHRYLSETGKLDEGKKLWLKVASVNPRMELLTFSLASRSGGIHAQQLSAPAA